MTVGQDVTGIDDGEPVPGAVVASRLVAATPNPFNPSTEVAYEVARAGRCALTVHDVRGRQIRTLFDGEAATGRHVAEWNGLDDAGKRVPSGIYMVRLRSAGGGEDLLKLTLVK
ncbi:MAG: T9SS type A sorting domain-containing protein [bacterium]|nr:T9SS type A sorting domain-containing protein [bacterium]